MIGEAFGPYTLVALLGRGGMGEVWRAHDTRKDRAVAVKVLGGWLGGDPGFAARFQREAALAARLYSPHIIPIHDYGDIAGRFYIEMPLVAGTDLEALIARHGPMSPERAVAVIEQIAEALARIFRRVAGGDLDTGADPVCEGRFCRVGMTVRPRSLGCAGSTGRSGSWVSGRSGLVVSRGRRARGAGRGRRGRGGPRVRGRAGAARRGGRDGPGRAGREKIRSRSRLGSQRRAGCSAKREQSGSRR